MRRKISLYIAEHLVELDDQELVLLNYTMEDLSNPTIVKNSYSQQITLKGTPTNNALFGDIYRLDRRLLYGGGSVGPDYNPSQKVSFAIYNETSEVLESGYCKLDTISRVKGDIEYHITLYGGLGSFIYALSYDDEGNKKSLASLTYLSDAPSEAELDFTINATNVANAWATNDVGEIDSIWQVINFAPAYNGIPEGNFAADKALVVPSYVGLRDMIGVYERKSGYALVNLAQKYDEWAVKDLRSYLQRPVLSMRAFLAAICKPINNGGYEVTTPFLEKDSFGRYGRLWMTLPMIPSIGTINTRKGELALSAPVRQTAAYEVSRYTISGSVPFGTKITATINMFLRYSLASTYTTLSSSVSTTDTQGVHGRQLVTFIQILAKSDSGSIVGGSKVQAIYDWHKTPKEMAERCGYVPPFAADYSPLSKATQYTRTGVYYTLDQDFTFIVEGQDVAYYDVHVKTYNITTRKVTRRGVVQEAIIDVVEPIRAQATLYHDYNTVYTSSYGESTLGDSDNKLTYDSASSLRSGAMITKAMLLSSSASPADYLLSYCKMFGLHILVDQATKTVTILDRASLYLNETIDLTKRVDTSKDIRLTPFVFDSKWYEFKQEGVGGAFFDEYRAAHGVDYGVQRVNTGYSFNAETNDLLEGNVFRNAATVLARSKYFTMITKSNHLVPSVFMDQGNTYTLWNPSTDESLDTPIPVPDNTVTVEYYNEYDHPGYDVEWARKMEFRDTDNKPIDGAGVLCWREGYNTYNYFRLTDDLAEMDILNGGVPCWQLNPAPQLGLRIPIYQRYFYGSEWTIEQSLDFGVPQELDIPQITYNADSTIYHKFWKNYITDRFDVNTKVMTCRVNLNGLQVGSELLRKFYWYGGSLWALNAIRNYSLTTDDPVECEFVQVQDKNNYLI